nr:MAG TPA: hypothetical protein [Caudoviricetes sp.]
MVPHIHVFATYGHGTAFRDAFHVFPDKRFLLMSRNNKNG